MLRECIIIGSGPAALMAAHCLSERGIQPVIFERRRGPGWKILVAGSSGLNISHDTPWPEFHGAYPRGGAELRAHLDRFPREAWLAFVKSLGEEVYLGSSRRYFIKNKKASPLLRAWLEHLGKRGAEIHYQEELVDFISQAGEVELIFKSGRKEKAKRVLLALGGASWEDEAPAWPALLRKKGIAFRDFTPANAGYEIAATTEFFREAEGKPIKGLLLRTAKGEKQGELMITKYGLEGTPVYTLGCPGTAALDLKPDLAAEKLLARLKEGNGSLKKRLEASAKLSAGALLLVKHLAPASAWDSPDNLAALIKNFPLTLTQPRPLSESISSRGGVAWEELGADLELKKAPGVFCAGEMIDWDAPTGGFLIQACVSTGASAAAGIVAGIR